MCGRDWSSDVCSSDLSESLIGADVEELKVEAHLAGSVQGQMGDGQVGGDRKSVV